MKRLLIVALAACGEDQRTVTLDKIRALTDEVCACTQPECRREVSNKLRMTMADGPEIGDWSASQLDRFKKLREEFDRCSLR